MLLYNTHPSAYIILPYRCIYLLLSGNCFIGYFFSLLFISNCIYCSSRNLYKMEILYIIFLSFISGCLELVIPKILNWCSPSNLQLVARLTKEIVQTYQICNPQFKYSEDLNPKRFLTSPSVGVLNDGYDNVNSDLILTVNFVLNHLDKSKRFVIHISFVFMLSLYIILWKYRKLNVDFRLMPPYSSRNLGMSL